tara:strand:- start:2372 stop:2797 length:426 start_codon:yes stop_codon:yes gene_type:complete
MYKKVYDKNKGKFIYVDAQTGIEISNVQNGAGIFDSLTKLFSSSVADAGRKALETAGKAALESGTKKVGSEVGNLAANKIANVLKNKTQNYRKSAPKQVGNLIVKELKRKNNDDINMKINKILSGGKLHGLENRINRLIYK